MIGDIVEIAEDGRHLSVYRGFLKVSDSKGEVGRKPLDEIYALIISANQATVSKNIMSSLAQHGAVVIFCGPTYLPISICSPYGLIYNSPARHQAQIECTKPLKKKLWKQIIQEKIRNQAEVLGWFKPDHPLVGKMRLMAEAVRSGDEGNLEAHTARLYWPALFGKNFVRDRNECGVNALLNYAYTVLRSASSRSVVGAGLIPSFGVHHKNMLNSFALADDLMEPFRPLADAVVISAMKESTELTPAIKKKLAAVLTVDLAGHHGVIPLFRAMHFLSLSLEKSFKRKKPCLKFPKLIRPEPAIDSPV